MPNDRDTSNGHMPLELDEYNRSKTNILRLKKKLPDALVRDLAQEVIRRVAAKGDALQHISIEPSPEDLDELCIALISDNDTAAADVISALRIEGSEPEVIYLKYLAEAARRLGEWWVEDKVDFTQVTFASGRMLAIMRGMKHLFENTTTLTAKQALFASVPGETHTMGVRMAADLFRKEGWDITLKVGLEHDALVSEIEKNPSGIVGLSVAGEHSISPLSRLVVALHISCPHVILLVSGQNIEASRSIFALMGIDVIVESVDDAMAQLSDLWDQKQASEA